MSKNKCCFVQCLNVWLDRPNTVVFGSIQVVGSSRLNEHTLAKSSPYIHSEHLEGVRRGANQHEFPTRHADPTGLCTQQLPSSLVSNTHTYTRNTEDRSAWEGFPSALHGSLYYVVDVVVLSAHHEFEAQGGN